MLYIPDIEEQIRQTKTPASARNYLAMLRRLRAYNGDDPRLSLSRIDAAYVAAFGRYLLDCGLTPASVRLYKKLMRATLRPHYSAEDRPLFAAAFGDVESANETDTRGISLADVRTLQSSSLSGSTQLQKIRDIFIFSLLGGGLPYSDLRRQCEAGEPEAPTPQQQQMLLSYRADYGLDMAESVRRLDPDRYHHLLSACGEQARLRRPLTAKSVTDGWIAAARALHIPAERIAAAAAGPTAIKSIVGVQAKAPEADGTASVDINRQQVADDLAAVADSLIDMRERWYALRGADADVADHIRSKIDATPWLRAMDPDLFSLPAGKKTRGRANLLQTLLFIHLTPAGARRLQRELPAGITIYSFRGSKVPAWIPDDEMRLFMLLADLSQDSLELHFPDREATPLPEPGTQAEITNGTLTGQVGIVKKTDTGRYLVTLEFQTLGGARVLAEVPPEFLRPL